MSEARVRSWGAELRRVHQLLRDALAIAVEAVEDDEPVRQTRDLLLHCWGFCVALDQHHRSEDATLFPEIAAARPDLVPTLAKLSQDHSLIAHLVRGLEHALETHASKDDRLRHLDGIAAVMESHFRYEERELVRVLEAIDDLGHDGRELFGPIA